MYTYSCKQLRCACISLQVEILSDDEDEEDNDVIPLGASDDKYRPQSLEKMIHLIAYIVEKSRDDNNQLQISQKDYYSIIGGKVDDNHYISGWGMWHFQNILCQVIQTSGDIV